MQDQRRAVEIGVNACGQPLGHGHRGKTASQPDVDPWIRLALLPFDAPQAFDQREEQVAAGAGDVGQGVPSAVIDHADRLRILGVTIDVERLGEPPSEIEIAGRLEEQVIAPRGFPKSG